MGTKLATMQGAVGQLATAANQLLPASSGAMTSMLSGMQTVQAGPSNTAAKNGSSGLIEGMTTLDTGIASLQAGVNGENGLKNGIASYTAGAASLQTGLATLAGNNQALTSGMTALATGANTLATGLDGGVTSLSGGVIKLKNGTKQLVSNNTTLLNGANQLTEGAGKIAEGSAKLADGSKELGSGLITLQDGTKTLQNGLSDGADEVCENETSDATLDMFAKPVLTEGTQITTVKNNGHAMAAYMLTVGLWVGCLAFCLMYPLTNFRGKLKSGTAWWASKAVILYPLAILMSGVVLVVLNKVNGFQPESMGRTFLVSAVTAVCFMSIMYYFNVLLGKVGSFLMLIFMVLQLAGSAGTYPVEISGSMVAKIHKFVPFTYTVDAFRSAIAGGGSVSFELGILAMIALVFSVLTVGVFHIRAKRMLESKPIVYEWIEEKGLA